MAKSQKRAAKTASGTTADRIARDDAIESQFAGRPSLRAMYERETTTGSKTGSGSKRGQPLFLKRGQPLFFVLDSVQNGVSLCFLFWILSEATFQWPGDRPVARTMSEVPARHAA